MRLVKKLLCFLALLSGIANAQIQVMGTVDHVIPWTSDNLGNITISVSGGSSPYTYTWNPGNVNTKDLTNASANSYSLIVKENGGVTANYYYNLGYKTRWTDFYGTKFRNDTLMETGAVSGNVTALTKNTLPANTDGWVEYVLPNFVYPYVFGLLDSASTSNYYSWEDIDFAFHETTGRNIYVWTSGYWSWLGTANTGDVIRIERIGNTYYLKKNNTTIASNTTNASKKNKVKAMLDTQPFANIGVSFTDTSSLGRLSLVNAYIDHVKPDTQDTLGNITLNIKGGDLPYTINWSNGTSSGNNTNLTRNSYSVTVKDAHGDSLKYNYKVGYKVMWQDLYGSGTTFNHDTLRADAATSTTGVSSAASLNELRPNTDGWAQFIVQDWGSPYVIGFSDSIMSSAKGTINDIQFAFHVNYQTNGYAWYGGYWTYIGSVKTGDVIWLERTGSTFYIKKNGTNVFNGSANASKKLRLKGTINDNYYLANIGTSFADSTSAYPLTAKGIVDHINTDGLDAVGNINLKIFGGVSPYSYTWTPGNTHNKDKNEIPQGIYSLIVKDYVGTQLTYTYNLGYKTKWMQFYQTAFRNDSLYATVPNTVNVSAISINQLDSYKDGWLEYVLPKYTGTYMIALLDSVSASNQQSQLDMDFAFHENNGYFYAWAGGYWTWLNTVKEGDVIRIEKTGSTFYLKKNNTNLYSYPALAHKKYRSKVLLSTPLVNIGCSFLNTLDAQLYKEHVNLTDNPYSGEVTVTPFGGIPPYQVQWPYNGGINSFTRTYLSQGSYTTVICDSTEVVCVPKTIGIGIKPTWQIKINSKITTDSVSVINNDSLGISVSNDLIRKNQETWFEGMINNTTHDIAIGFIAMKDTTGSYTPAFGDTAMLNRINYSYDLMNRAINRTLPYSGSDSILNLSNAYNDVHFIRLNNGIIKSLLKGSAYANNYPYKSGDIVKIGRTQNGFIYTSINDKIVFTHTANISSRYLYSGLIIGTNAPFGNKGVLTQPGTGVILNINTYAPLKKQIDGGYYNLTLNKLYFKVDGQYANTSLKYNVYNKNNVIVAANPPLVSPPAPNLANTTVVLSGDNRYTLNATTLTAGEFFILEVINEKNEKFYLRFKR